MKAGRLARFDYEYERNGTANLFMMFARLALHFQTSAFAGDESGWSFLRRTDMVF